MTVSAINGVSAYPTAAHEKFTRIAICHSIGKIYQFDYEHIYGYIYSPDYNRLMCQFVLKQKVDYEIIPPDSDVIVPFFKEVTDVKNKIGQFIPVSSIYTLKQLKDAGIDTFDYPDVLTVQTSLSCGGGSKYCSKHYRQIVDCGSNFVKCVALQFVRMLWPDVLQLPPKGLGEKTLDDDIIEINLAKIEVQDTPGNAQSTYSNLLNRTTS